MKTITTTAAALVISALSISAFAAQATNHITTIDAGSNMVPGTHVVKGSNDAAFNAHTLVAGEWE